MVQHCLRLYGPASVILFIQGKTEVVESKLFDHEITEAGPYNRRQCCTISPVDVV